MLPLSRLTSKLKSKVGMNPQEGLAEMSQVNDAVASFGNARVAEEDFSSLSTISECVADNTEIGSEEERNRITSRL